MSTRAGSGWQTSLADLSLILFMVMAGVVSRQPAKPPRPPAASTAAPAKEAAHEGPSQQTEPLSVYIAAAGAPPLDTWLRDQAVDPRQQLTITAHYSRSDAAGQARALAQAEQLLDHAGQLGHAARLVVEPGEGPPRAVLAYDAPDAAGAIQ